MLKRYADVLDGETEKAVNALYRQQATIAGSARSTGR
jgi:hypothetical protein